MESEIELKTRIAEYAAEIAKIKKPYESIVEKTEKAMKTLKKCTIKRLVLDCAIFVGGLGLWAGGVGSEAFAFISLPIFMGVPAAIVIFNITKKKCKNTISSNENKMSELATLIAPYEKKIAETEFDLCNKVRERKYRNTILVASTFYTIYVRIDGSDYGYVTGGSSAYSVTEGTHNVQFYFIEDGTTNQFENNVIDFNGNTFCIEFDDYGRCHTMTFHEFYRAYL